MKRADLRTWLAVTPVSGHARIVYIGLLAHADNGGWSCPSIPTIAAMFGLGTTTVRVALRELEAAGQVTRTPRDGMPTGYTLTANPNVTRWPTPTPGVGHPNADPNADPNATRREKELEGIRRNGAREPGCDPDAPPAPEAQLDLATLHERRGQIVGAARKQQRKKEHAP